MHNNTTGALNTGGSASIPVLVGSANVPFRVTLVFHDAPGAANSIDPVVNNLDLVVTDPNGVVYYGNNFSGGVSVPGGAPDPLNNVEQVLVNTAATGVWNITVQGHAVNIGKQGYAVVASGGREYVPRGRHELRWISGLWRHQPLCAGAQRSGRLSAGDTAAVTS